MKITPTDEEGFRGLVVVVCDTTKFAKLYPVRNYDATSLAICIFQYCCSYGLVDLIHSDQGSDLNSLRFAHLTSW
jgi:hypothetical protein